MHEAIHSTVFENSEYNRWFGNIMAFYFNPVVVYSVVRFTHLKHHARTNQPDDPDIWVCGSNIITSILRCFSINLGYLLYYLKHGSTRPSSEKIAFYSKLIIGIITFGLLCYLGYFSQLFWLSLVPSIVGSGILIFTLAYLTHQPHGAVRSVDPYQATRLLSAWLIPMKIYCVVSYQQTTDILPHLFAD